MKTTCLSTGITAILLLSLTACKKESAGFRRSETILGTWVVSAVGTDENRNKILDPAEYDTSGANFFSSLTFKADGTAVNVYQRPGRPQETNSDLRWRLTNSDQQLDIISAADTLSGQILVLDKTNLELYFPDAVFPQISINKRQ